MTISNKISFVVDFVTDLSANSNKISGFTDTSGAAIGSKFTSNKINSNFLRSFDPSSKIKSTSLTATTPFQYPVLTVETLPDPTNLYGYCAYIADPLEAYYKFDNNGNDSSGSSRNLTFTGTEAYVAGLFGNAYDLNGNSANYATYPNIAVLDLLEGSAISFWYKPNVLSGQVLIEKLREAPVRGWSISLQASGAIGFEHYNGVDDVTIGFSGSQACAAGSWNHIVINNDGITVKVYINGVEHDSDTAPTAGVLEGAPVDFTIGRRRISPSPFPANGDFDEVAVWSRALSLDELGSLYNSGAGQELAVAPGNALAYSDGYCWRLWNNQEEIVL